MDGWRKGEGGMEGAMLAWIREREREGEGGGGRGRERERGREIGRKQKSVTERPDISGRETTKRESAILYR